MRHRAIGNIPDGPPAQGHGQPHPDHPQAALNHAWREGKAPSDEAWRRVRPFHNVDAPKIRYLNSGEECIALARVCEVNFRQLVQAALYTGCRYGELTALRVSDYDPASSTLRIRRSKLGQASTRLR